jgi:hypothetical protein
MSRLQVLVHRPRRTLAALATVLVAVGITAASGANFTASSANPNNTFAAGTLSIANSTTTILSASAMKPGGPASVGTVDIENDGSTSGAFTLTRGTPADDDATHPLSGKLNVTVVDCGAFAGSTAPQCGDAGDDTKYSGTLADMGSAGAPIEALGVYSGGEKHRYEFRVALDVSADDNYQGDESTVAFNWDAVTD